MCFVHMCIEHMYRAQTNFAVVQCWIHKLDVILNYLVSFKLKLSATYWEHFNQIEQSTHSLKIYLKLHISKYILKSQNALIYCNWYIIMATLEILVWNMNTHVLCEMTRSGNLKLPLLKLYSFLVMGTPQSPLKLTFWNILLLILNIIIKLCH